MEEEPDSRRFARAASETFELLRVGMSGSLDQSASDHEVARPKAWSTVAVSLLSWAKLTDESKSLLVIRACLSGNFRLLV